MHTKKLLAFGTTVLAAAVLVAGCGGGSDAEDPIVSWVCDSCGHTAALPHKNQSPDCPKCPTGQMVQQVSVKCKKCNTVFEAYQVNWSPNAPRAEAKRKEADEHGPLPKGMTFPEGSVQLVRRPGGQWAWSESRAGIQIMRRPRCPNCGELNVGQYIEIERASSP